MLEMAGQSARTPAAKSRRKSWGMGMFRFREMANIRSLRVRAAWAILVAAKLDNEVGSVMCWQAGNPMPISAAIAIRRHVVCMGRIVAALRRWINLPARPWRQVFHGVENRRKSFPCYVKVFHGT